MINNVYMVQSTRKTRITQIHEVFQKNDPGQCGGESPRVGGRNASNSKEGREGWENEKQIGLGAGEDDRHHHLHQLTQ